jgi:hypothetical protein
MLLSVTEGGAQFGSLTKYESLHVRELIMGRLKEMIVSDNQAPDFLISTMAPTKERMDPAGEGGAKVNLYFVTCLPEVAVQRAFDRARDKSNIEDYNRYMTTKEILESHRKASVMLPESLALARRDLRLFDTSKRPTTLVATMDSHNKEMRIFSPKVFLSFVRKSFINTDAKSSAQLYPVEVSDRDWAAALCKYQDAKVSFNFRYSEEHGFPNPMLQHIKEFPRTQDERENEVRKMMHDSLPETYLWVGHDRAIVSDFSTFVTAFGKRMAEAMLIELGSRWPLAVRNYAGCELFSVDKMTPIRYFNPGQEQDTVDFDLRAILSKVVPAIEANRKGNRHDRRRSDTQTCTSSSAT